MCVGVGVGRCGGGWSGIRRPGGLPGVAGGRGDAEVGWSLLPGGPVGGSDRFRPR